MLKEAGDLAQQLRTVVASIKTQRESNEVRGPGVGGHAQAPTSPRGQLAAHLPCRSSPSVAGGCFQQPP